jgi:hypothetical protein
MLASNDEWERERKIMIENNERLIQEIWYSKGADKVEELRNGKVDYMDFFRSFSVKEQKKINKLMRESIRLDYLKPGEELMKPKRTKREKLC